MKFYLWFILAAVLVLTGTGTATVSAEDSAPVLKHVIVKSYPHARDAFTQGLVFQNGFLYESTGLYKKSSLRKVDLTSGKVLQNYDLPSIFFGEGITIYKNKIVQLTWKRKMGFVYDKESFEVLKTFTYPTEGWGITHDGKRLIMSDGSATLYFLDPETFEETGRIEVSDHTGPIKGLNELEYIKGELFANILPTTRIARISPQTGKVTGWIDLKGILPMERQADALNGIAYDEKNNRIFVTGKYWPTLFEIMIVEPE